MHLHDVSIRAGSHTQAAIHSHTSDLDKHALSRYQFSHFCKTVAVHLLRNNDQKVLIWGERPFGNGRVQVVMPPLSYLYVCRKVCMYVCVRARARVCVPRCVYICHLSRICATAAHSQERHAAATSTPLWSHAKIRLRIKAQYQRISRTAIRQLSAQVGPLDLGQGNTVLRLKP